MSDSTHRVEVVPVKLEPCPNSDKLSIVNVFNYQVIVRTEDWKDGDLGAYIVPDSVVDTTRPEFEFLGNDTRIIARRFRGSWSEGLLVKAPPGAREGDDVAVALGVTRYEPPVKYGLRGPALKMQRPMPKLFTARWFRWLYWSVKRWWQGEAGEIAGPIVPVYDVEAYRRYADLLEPGEQVIISEKIHGCNARFMYDGKRQFCGSRREWKREHKFDLWWSAFAAHPWLGELCRAYPQHVFYGEVYGDVQDLTYGAKEGELFVCIFDVWTPEKKWMNSGDVYGLIHKHHPPVLYMGPYNPEVVEKLVDGESLLPTANCIREGIVIKPMEERWHPRVGRVALKVVSRQYLERSGK